MCESLPGSPLLTRKVTPLQGNNPPRFQEGSNPRITITRATPTQRERWRKLLQKARRADQSGVSLVKHSTDPTSQPVDSHQQQEPETFISLIQTGPYVQSYTWLKRQLAHCDSRWMLRFLELDGLGILYSALQKLTEKSHLSIAHAYAQVECVACFRAMMNSQAGLDYIIDDTEFIRKLATALDTSNATVKKQVFELLSALCMYSSEGYIRAIDALEHYKTSQNQRYRFSLIIEELRKADAISYKTTLVAFINCILIATESLEERVRLRNELVGLKLLDVLSNLRKECSEDPDLVVQLDVFDDNKIADEEQFSGPEGVDLNNAIDVFHAIFKQVCDTPQITPFLTILQHLLRIDTREPISDAVWEVAEKLVHKSILLEKKEHRERLLKLGERELIKAVTTFQSPSGGDEDGTRGRSSSTSYARERKRSIFTTEDIPGKALIKPETEMGIADALVSPHTTSNEALARDTSDKSYDRSPVNISSPPPPPPPPAPPSMRTAPPPPPLPGCGPPIPPPPPGMGSTPPPPPPPGMGGPPPPPGAPSVRSVPKPTVVPSVKPKARMRTLNWSKLPPHKVMNEKSIWSKVNQINNGFNADWENLEELFCQQNLMKQKRKEGKEGEVKKKRESTEITMLDGKRSLHVNIFLKQFRSTNETIVSLIEGGKSGEIGAEKLKSLLKIMPESDEVDMLRSFDGDFNKLGQAEKFYKMLIEIPFYKLRVDSMLLKEEFSSDMDFLIPSIESIIMASRELLGSKSLKEILYLVLLTGNFLNAGGYAGNAMGFKVASLLKLVETRANKPRMNLMHCVAEMAEKKDKTLLNFPDELTQLEEASKFSLEQLTGDINTLEERVNTIETHLEEISVDESATSVKRYVQEIVKMSREDLEELREMMEFVDQMKGKLADFFCDDVETFNLEECILTFKIFCEKFKKAIEENETRREQEQKAEQRRQQREEQKRVKDNRKSSSRSSTSSQSSSSTTGGRIVDKLLGTIRDGFSSRKSPDSIGDATDSDYGSRPTSPGPDEDTGSGLTRGTPMRKSWQKFDQLNSITENSSAATAENDDNRSVSSGVSSQGTWGSTGSHDTSPSNTMTSSKRVRSQQRPRSADDDSLFDMLLQGNEEEALEKFESFKREGSLRRSGRRQSRRYTDVVSADTRERTESPLNSPMMTRKSKSVDHTDGGKDITSPVSIPNGGLRRHRSVLDSPQDSIALRAIARRERNKESFSDVSSTSPIESTSKSLLPVRGLRRSQSDSGGVGDALRDRESSDISYASNESRLGSFNDMDSPKTEKSDINISSKIGDFSHENSNASVGSDTNRSVFASTSPKSRCRANRRKNSSDETQNDSAFIDNTRLGDTSTSDCDRVVTPSCVSVPVKDDEVTVEEKVTNWQNKLQHVDVEAALDTVETTLVDRERKNREHIHDINNSMDESTTSHQSNYRSRHRRWRTVDGELDTQKSREERTERRKSQDIYKDHETSVFLDRPINAHLAVEGMSLVQEYRDRINQDRRAIEEIMAVGPVKDIDRPRGLKAIQLKRAQSMPPQHKPVVDEDPWDSIDRQQVEIRRDIIDMKVRATTPERESVSSNPSIQAPRSKSPDSKNTVYQLADADVYILRENKTGKCNEDSSEVSAKTSLANRTNANLSPPICDVNDNTIPLSRASKENGSPKPRNLKSVAQPIKSENGPELRKPRDLNNLAKPGVAKPRLTKSISTPSSMSSNAKSPRSSGRSLLRPNNGLSSSGRSTPTSGRSTPTSLNRTIEATKRSPRQRTSSGDSSDLKPDRRRSDSNSSNVSSVSSTGTQGSRTPRAASIKSRADSASSNVSRTSLASERNARLNTPRGSVSSVKSSGSTTSIPKQGASKLKPSTGTSVNRSPRSQPFARNAPERKTMPARSNVTGSITNRGGKARTSARATLEQSDKNSNSSIRSPSSNDKKSSTSSSIVNEKKPSTTTASIQRPNSLALNSKTNRTTGKTIRQQLKEDVAAKRELRDNADTDDASSMSSLGDALDKEKTEKKRTRTIGQNGTTKASPLVRTAPVRRTASRSNTASPRITSRNGLAKSSSKPIGSSSNTRNSPPNTNVRSTSSTTGARVKKTQTGIRKAENVDKSDVSVNDIQCNFDDTLNENAGQSQDKTPTSVDPRLPYVPLVRSNSDPDLLKSTMSTSDSNLQREPDIKSSLHRASTMSLPPDARKRGPPQSLKAMRAKPSRLSKFIRKLSGQRSHGSGDKRPDSIAESYEDSHVDLIDVEEDIQEIIRKPQSVSASTKTKVAPIKETKASRLTAPTASSLRRSKSAAATSKTGQTKNATQQHGFRPRFGFGSGHYEKSTTATKSQRSASGK
ncbi:LOW QUALITY PROTEIN: uncharacterized protein [Amphiura filiformis]|uniref:LOW QUALITY PROTEIN: uncharacterized protein n=1 Tax=Amphiura filiformis TaxID=82378 RepID=UPI003B21221C